MKRNSLSVFLSGCVTFEEASKSTFDAGRNEQKAETARENQDEALALIYEQKARSDRRKADKSLLELILGSSFEEVISYEHNE